MSYLSQHFALEIAWISAVLFLLQACSTARLVGPWSVPDPPSLEELRPFPRQTGFVGCLSDPPPTLVPAQGECPDGSTQVAVMSLGGFSQIPPWERDVRDAWARMRAKVEDYIRRVDGLVEAINRNAR